MRALVKSKILLLLLAVATLTSFSPAWANPGRAASLFFRAEGASRASTSVSNGLRFRSAEIGTTTSPIRQNLGLAGVNQQLRDRAYAAMGEAQMQLYSYNYPSDENSQSSAGELDPQVIAAVCENRPNAAKTARGILYRKAWILTGASKLRDDLVQETILQLWTACSRLVKNLPRDQPDYLWGIMTNTWTHIIRKETRYSAVESMEAFDKLLVNENNPSVLAEQKELDARFNQELAYLPARQKEALSMAMYGMSAAQIASLMGTRTDTTKDNLKKARARMKAALAPTSDDMVWATATAK